MTTPLDLALTTIGLDEFAFDQLTANPSLAETRQRLLCFPIGVRDSALLSLEHIAQVFRVEVAEILPIPEMSDCVLGIGNWQGEMLWLVDLPALVGYPSLAKQKQLPESLMVIVIQVDNKTLGLGIQQVNDVELHDLQQLQPATIGLFSPSFLPFVLGTLPGSSHAVIDINAIASYSLWQQTGE
jgi:positive phototaxis protein PixI